MFCEEIVNKLNNTKVLFVDDEKQITDMFCNLFKNGLGIECYGAYDGKEALELFKKMKHDIVISDIKMPNMDGLDMAMSILKIKSDTKVIFVSGHKDEFYSEDLKEYENNIVYVDKPISTFKLQSALERLFNI